jgi:hypothetical protein
MLNASVERLGGRVLGQAEDVTTPDPRQPAGARGGRWTSAPPRCG